MLFEPNEFKVNTFMVELGDIDIFITQKDNNSINN